MKQIGKTATSVNLKDTDKELLHALMVLDENYRYASYDHNLKIVVKWLRVKTRTISGLEKFIEISLVVCVALMLA